MSAILECEEIKVVDGYDDELCNRPAGERWDPLGAANDQEDECNLSFKDDFGHGLSQRYIFQ